MTFNPSNFLFEHFVPESCFKFPLSRGCRSDAHSFLSSSQKNLQEWSVKGRYCCKLDARKVDWEPTLHY